MVKPFRLFLLLSPISLTLVSQAQVGLQIETATKVQFNASAGKRYQVYATTNLDRTGWAALGAPQEGSDGAITFFHTTTGDQKVFFKVEEATGSGTPSGGGTPQVLISRARLNLNGQDLSGLTLTNEDLNTFSFANAILRNVDLSGTILSNATIVGADFSGSKLVGADLSRASGFNVNFSGADLRNARLGEQDGNFRNANLANAVIIPGGNFGGDLTGVKGTHLLATNAILTFKHTEGADFTGSDFSGASITWSTSFAGANLTGVNFVNAEFSAYAGDPLGPGTIVAFDNANLTDADLTGARKFYDAPGIIYKNTKMPDGTLRTGIGQGLSPLIGKTLALTYTGGGGEKFIFVTDTTGKYDTLGDPLTYSFDRSTGNLHIEHQNASYDLVLDPTRSSGHLKITYTPYPGTPPSEVAADYTLL